MQSSVRWVVVLVWATALWAQTPAQLIDQLTGAKDAAAVPAEQRGSAIKTAVEGLLPGLAADDADAKSQAQAQLERLAFYAGRPGNEADRQAVVAAVLPLATRPGIRFARQVLLLQVQHLGRAEAVPGLVALLADADAVIAQSARMALERNPSAEAGRALLDALGKAGGEARIAFINALGHRREAAATGALAKLLGDGPVGAAAADALAEIATPEAVAALSKPPAGTPTALVENALLVAADRIADTDPARSATLFDELLRSATQQDVRLAALRGWALHTAEPPLPALLDLMANDDPTGHVAARLALELPGATVAATCADRLVGLPEAIQVILCGALEERADKAALPGLRALAARADAPPASRAAAVTALGSLGAVAEVKLLLDLEDEADPVGAAVREALSKIGGPDVTDLLLEQLANGDAARRAQVVRLLQFHRGPTVTKALLDLAGGNAARPARAAALKALGEVGAPGDFAPLLAALPQLAAAGLGQEAASAAKALQSQQASSQATAEPVLKALASATGEARPALLALLGPTGAPAARDVLIQALQNGPDADREAAVAAFGEWPDGTPLDEVVKVVAAGQAGPDGDEVAAVVRHLAALSGRDDALVVDTIEQALGHVADDAKPSYLAGLARVPHPRVLDILRANIDHVPGTARLLADACEVLAGAYRTEALAALDDVAKARDGQYKPAADRVRAIIGRWTDYITAWRMSPPFAPPGWNMSRLHREKVPGEADPDKTVWSIVPGGLLSDQGIVDFDLADFFGDNRAIVLRTTIIADQAKEARLEVGSDDSVRIYLNGQVVLDNEVARAHGYGQDKPDISLQAGRNPLVVKVVNGGANWKVSVRLRARDGGEITGLQYSVD